MILTPIQLDVPHEDVDATELLIKEAHKKSRRRRAGYGLVALAVVAVVVLAIVASGTLDRSPARTSNGTPSSEVAVGLPQCSAPQLHVVQYTPLESAADYGVIVVRLKNVSAHECSLAGYPSVQGINQWNGAVFTASHTRDSYMGGWESTKPLPVVALRAKSGVASFLVDYITGDDIRACPYLNSLRVKVPHSTTVFTLTSTKLQACKNFEVHPFVSGLTGSNRA
ncbi:MAG TPA: DUF4232 domain-containing protein [Acidimicrobiales bacterium]